MMAGFSHRTIPGLATVTEPSRVVFLSYASQDAAAALRIADALRTAGIEVWLDQSELRGGDAWDRQIRTLIRECRLFVPVISANTEARDEGYFRREWRLAVDRTHDMSERKAFLVPVVIDDTPQRGASVPEKFRDVQWTYLPSGEKSPEFIARVARLLSADSEGNGPPSPQASPAATTHHSTRQDADGHKREPPRSVAVLPFANLSSDREQEYFSDGLTEELINHLAHVRGLRVLGRTSSFAFKGKNEDLRVIGKKLSVGYALEGSVRKSGNRLRITAQLVDCADGYHLWSETFDRDLEDVFKTQNDISRSVANALGIALGVAESVPLGGTRSVEAYELYLRGQSLHRLFGPPELRRAVELFHKALVLDPEFALAWTGLAGSLMLIAAYLPEKAPEVHSGWQHAVERALEIAPHLSVSHAANARWQIYAQNWIAAEEASRKAVELAPESAVSHTLAVTLACVGRVEESIDACRTARVADPLSLLISTFLQLSLTTARRYDEAEAEYERSRDLAGTRDAIEDVALRRAWIQKAPSREIRARLERYLAQDRVPMPVQSEMLEWIEQPDLACKRLREVFTDPAYQDPTRQFRIALWAAQFDDTDLALGALRRAYVEMRSWTTYLIWLPTYQKVRQDLRFKDLLRDLKIVDYWRATGKWGDFARPVGADDFEVS